MGRGSRPRHEAERRKGKEKGRSVIGVWMLWEYEMRMYGTEGMGWGKGAGWNPRCEGEGGMHAVVVVQG